MPSPLRDWVPCAGAGWHLCQGRESCSMWPPFLADFSRFGHLRRPPTVPWPGPAKEVPMARLRPLSQLDPLDRLLGEAPAIQTLREHIHHLAHFDATGNPVVPTVLLQG